jgi:hypothetical protein
VLTFASDGTVEGEVVKAGRLLMLFYPDATWTCGSVPGHARSTTLTLPT